jgi:hypothetical protein
MLISTFSSQVAGGVMLTRRIVLPRMRRWYFDHDRPGMTSPAWLPVDK